MPMAELTTKPSYAPEADPLASLAKMSMTAGLGSQDYVAINNVAIGAVVLGLFGVLALVWPLVLISSAGGVVCAIIAWIQIYSSNGTQTGRSIVLFALLLSLGIGGYVAARTVGGELQDRQDTQAISQVVDKFGNYLAGHQYDQAYVLCSDDFRQRVSVSKFTETFETQDRLGQAGSLRSVAWNGTDDWFGTEANGDRIAVARTKWAYEKLPQPFPQNISFIKVIDDSSTHWLINDIPSFFPKPRKGAGGPEGPGAGDASPAGPAMQQ